MAESGSSQLERLDRIKDTYGGDAAAAKRRLLGALAARRLSTADEVLSFHEILLLLRAYPDDQATLDLVERILAAFGERGDLRRFRRALADTGIAGTAVHYRFFWTTARMLAQRWPDRLTIDWAAFDDRDKLEDHLPLLATFSETPALDEIALSPREWLDRLKGPEETDATFLVKRFQALRTGDDERRWLYERLDPPVCLDPGPTTPSRTAARYERAPVTFQKRPLDRGRPRLRRAAARSPKAVRSLPPRQGRRIVEMAREAMVVRHRDLYGFEHGDANDVRLFEFEDGLAYAGIGLLPERRLMLESVYSFLTLKNGVPIGYVLASGLLGSSEVALNVFPAFRGGETARNYGCVLAMVRWLFGADAFAVDPYQLGHDNDEGLKSGAWWFYEKLGFRPHDAEVKRLVREEKARLAANPGSRTSKATLQRLSAVPVFLHLGKPRSDVLARVSLGQIGLRITDFLAGRFGAKREAGLRTCARDAAKRLGVRPPAGPRGVKLAWERWSPLILAIDGVERWRAEERRAAAAVVRAKGGRRESDFVSRFDAHAKLREAVLGLAEEES